MRVIELLIFVPLLVYVDCTKQILKCYQCAVEENKHCTDEYLTPCPDDQAYDSCMSRISRTKDQGFLIQKSCALAPCTFRDPNQSSGLGLDDCDRSKDEYDCVSCCKTDGCNTGSGNVVSSIRFATAVLAMLSAFMYRNLNL